jgi:carboxylesterase
MSYPMLQNTGRAVGRPHRGSLRSVIIVALMGLTAGAVITLMTPWRISNLRPHPRPVSDYAAALQRLEAMQARETEPMNPLCQLQVLSHGQRTERAIVLVHGYTNCPQQFAALGKRFYDLGYNVLIAPLPHHGLADRLTDAQGLMRADELTAYADEVVDIGQGLGEQVAMMGLSLGGNITAWAAQNRSDLDLAVIISPAFGYQEVPTPLTAPMTNYYLMKSNTFVWWQNDQQADYQPKYQYPRYSTRALAEVLRLGFSVQVAARQSRPAARALVVVTNPSDPSINLELIQQVVHNWQAHGAPLTTFAFDAGLGLPHDLVDPSNLDPKLVNEVIYPQLIRLVEQSMP